MAVPNPCCCSLRTGTQIVAIVNIVLTGLSLFFLALPLFAAGVIVAAAAGGNLKTEDGEAISFAVVLIVFIILLVVVLLTVLSLISSILLLVGANKRHVGYCRFWIIVTLVFLCLYITNTIMTASLGKFKEEDEDAHTAKKMNLVANVISTLVGVLIVLYEVWVVYAFIDELKRNEREGNTAVAYSASGGEAGHPYRPTTTNQGVVYSKPGEVSPPPGYSAPGVYPPLGTYPQLPPTYAPTNEKQGFPEA